MSLTSPLALARSIRPTVWMTPASATGSRLIAMMRAARSSVAISRRALMRPSPLAVGMTPAARAV